MGDAAAKASDAATGAAAGASEAVGDAAAKASDAASDAAAGAAGAVAGAMPDATTEMPTVPISDTASAPPSFDAPATPPSGWSAPSAPSTDDTTVQGVTSPPPAPDAAPAMAPPVTPPIAEPGAAPLGGDPSLGGPPAADIADEEEGADVGGGLVALLGAAALIVGSFLDWGKAAGSLVSGSVNGLTGSNGWGTLIAGLVIALCAGALFMGRRAPWVAGVLAVAALVALGLGIFSYFDIGSTSDDLPGIVAWRPA